MFLCTTADSPNGPITFNMVGVMASYGCPGLLILLIPAFGEVAVEKLPDDSRDPGEAGVYASDGNL